jgi:hypothetical protein
LDLPKLHQQKKDIGKIVFYEKKDVGGFIFLAVDGTEIGHHNRIPLWMFGLLY